uniref:Uncharacterized protein n=1 Tax=mine drainage metagenome TaxID=410659 RepID=E6PDC6_9ZZZZ
MHSMDSTTIPNIKRTNMGMMNPPSSVGYVFIDSIDGFVFLVGPTSFASPGMSELALPNNMHARRASWPPSIPRTSFSPT